MMPGRNWDVMDGHGKLCCKSSDICIIGYLSLIAVNYPAILIHT